LTKIQLLVSCFASQNNFEGRALFAAMATAGWKMAGTHLYSNSCGFYHLNFWWWLRLFVGCTVRAFRQYL